MREITLQEKPMTNEILEKVKKIISEDEGRVSRFKMWKRRYMTEEVPIFSRELPSIQKINNKLNFDYLSLLVNTKTYHYLGSPVSIITDEIKDETIQDTIRRFKRHTEFNRVLAEVGKQASLYGWGSILTYIDEDGEFNFTEIEPYDTYFSKDKKIAIREIESFVDDTRVFEIYDSTHKYVISGKEVSKLILLEDGKPHFMKKIPVIKFRNNKDELNEFYKVRNLLDVLDRLYSDISSEIEQFRLAYIKFKGVEPDAETIEKMMQTGALTLPDSDCDVDFITKKLPVTEVLAVIKEVKQEMYRIAMNYDTSSTDHLGQLTNTGIYYKMKPINDNAKDTIQYFEVALKELMQMYSHYLEFKNIKLDPLSISFQFTLETPRNLKEEAEVQKVLDGLVATETRLKLASFIENPVEELQKIEEEQRGKINLEEYEFTTGE